MYCYKCYSVVGNVCWYRLTFDSVVVHVALCYGPCLLGRFLFYSVPLVLIEAGLFTLASLGSREKIVLAYKVF
jgi:hypothetical protein